MATDPRLGGIRPYKSPNKTTTASNPSTGMGASISNRNAKAFDNPPLGNSNNGLTMQRQFDPNAPAGRGGKAKAYNNAKAFEERTGGAPKGKSNPKVANYISQRQQAGEFGGGNVAYKAIQDEKAANLREEKIAGEPSRTGALTGGSTKYLSPHLRFPSDVDAEPGMGNQGHYVMFTMNEIKDSVIAPPQDQVANAEYGMGGAVATANGALLNEAKKTNPTFTKKQLAYFAKYDQALTDAGKLAQKRGDVLKERDAAFGGLGAEYATGKVTKADLDAVGTKKLFKEFAQSYKIVETYDEVSQQLILGSGEFMNRYFKEEQTQANFHVGDMRTNIIKRKETVRVAGSITLFMPPQVVTTSTADYTDTEVGTGAAMAVAFLDRFGVSGMGGVGENLTKTLQQSTPEIKEALSNIGMKSIGMMPGFQGAAAIRDMKRGFIRAPKMELAFKGIGKRSFQFDFKMIPKSREEAETVRRIVKTFRAGMLPEFLKGTDRSSRFFKMPNTFDIQYLYNGSENQYLHKISTCVCKSVAVTYGGGGRYQTFEPNEKGASPTETNIALQFEELELITKERVMEGF